MNTLRATRWVSRLGVPLLLVCMLVMWWNFGLLRVPAGMDTMPDTHPPGTLCLIEKRPSHVAVGSVVFLDLPQGGTVLSRVVAVRPDGLKIRHDNRHSGYLALEQRVYPLSAVRGLVLTMMVP